MLSIRFKWGNSSRSIFDVLLFTFAITPAGLYVGGTFKKRCQWSLSVSIATILTSSFSQICCTSSLKHKSTCSLRNIFLRYRGQNTKWSLRRLTVVLVLRHSSIPILYHSDRTFAMPACTIRKQKRTMARSEKVNLKVMSNLIKV